MEAAELVDRMDRAEVDKAPIWLEPPYTKDIDPVDRAVYEATQDYPDGFIGFGWANPRPGKPRTLDTIERCFGRPGATSSRGRSTPRLTFPKRTAATWPTGCWPARGWRRGERAVCRTSRNWGVNLDRNGW